ncbi:MULTISPECIES: type II toxin-antitoxin system death-on-curing family toxin [Variovorax]|uniref:Death-on-curing protein n=2 Tax=Variovorax paradoxus TaxID=34073 RepID=A0AAW8EKF2_VARPD|nr:type II toxin-antitoxin system death-on-curing family toxin [Variovorax paradoxus]MBW8719423.1 type II toxin-antitoxin system death-on-curing family toxin [Variovorax paradoxus]MDP9973313.1 death-on-curing protein [Variovorax paradoxus]
MSAANDAWVWLSLQLIHAVHEEQLAEHGGPAGVRDEGLLVSAMGRPQNRALYESPDAAALAASYAFGIARNHPFTDGNKRTAFVAMEVFLDLNGFELRATDHDCVLTTLKLAAGQLEEEALAEWIRAHLAPRSS